MPVIYYFQLYECPNVFVYFKDEPPGLFGLFNFFKASATNYVNLA